MMLASIAGAIVVFVFAGEFSLNETLSAHTRLLDATSRFIADEAPKIQSLLAQLAPPIKAIGGIAEAAIDPLGRLRDVSEATEDMYAAAQDAARKLRDVSEQLELLARTCDHAIADVQSFVRDLENGEDSEKHRLVGVIGGALESISSSLREYSNLIPDADRFLEVGARFFAAGAEMMQTQRVFLSSSTEAFSSVARLTSQITESIRAIELIVEEVGSSASPRGVPSTTTQVFSNMVSTTTAITRIGATVVLAGMLYALSVMYRNSRVSARRSTDIATALVLTTGKNNDGMEDVMRLLGGAIDDPQLVDPSKASPGMKTPEGKA